MKISFYIQPKAHKTEFVGLHGEFLKIKIKAPPVDGEANAELVRFLSDYFKISRQSVTLVAGEKNRTKVVQFQAPEAKLNEIQAQLISLGYKK